MMIEISLAIVTGVALGSLVTYVYCAEDELETTELGPSEYRVKIDGRVDYTEEFVNYCKQKIRSKGLQRYNNSEIFIKGILIKADDEFINIEDYEGDVPASYYVRYEVSGREKVLEV